MIADFDDFCLWIYVIVDTFYQQLAPIVRRPGPAPRCSDSDLLTMAIVGECHGWEVETELLANWQAHRDLFPQLPSQSRFNRRRRQLMWLMNLIRRLVLQVLDVAQEQQTVIDSLLIPVVQFHLAPAARGDWAEHWQGVLQKQTIYGYKLHRLVTVGGVILDFELAPANEADLVVGAELLAERRAHRLDGVRGQGLH